MPLTLENQEAQNWVVRKIGVIGPGIVGMPMAAMLAGARIRQGSEHPAKVVLVQRDSLTSGWKVGAIKSGISPIKGIEPALDSIVRSGIADGILNATHDTAELYDADVILVCVQTDKKGQQPDYGPLFSSLEALAQALKNKPDDNIPLVIIESTLAPSTMGTLIRDHFACYGLLDGRDVLLGFSPNRVMPGRLVERVRTSDKLVSGLLPITPRLIKSLYSRIVTCGTLYETNTLTAEIVKTTENAYRDVRIAYASELSRFCDRNSIDFFQLRDAVNCSLDQSDAARSNPNAVPSGGLLVPTLGVGGHCLPKDGILLLWRRIEQDRPANTLIEQARRINDASPAWTIHLAESIAGDLNDMHIALLGAAYRFDSEDTRNSPSLVLARQLLEKGALVRIHDPYVNPGDQNLRRLDLMAHFTNDLSTATQEAEVLIACTGHVDYLDANGITTMSPQLHAVVDACNLWQRAAFAENVRYTGIGRGTNAPSDDLVACATQGFRAVEHGFARELNDTIEFLNSHYADDPFNKVSYSEVQRLAATCSTGCRLAEPTYTPAPSPIQGFQSTLVELASPRELSAEIGI